MNIIICDSILGSILQLNSDICIFKLTYEVCNVSEKGNCVFHNMNQICTNTCTLYQYMGSWGRYSRACVVIIGT